MSANYKTPRISDNGRVDRLLIGGTVGGAALGAVGSDDTVPGLVSAVVVGALVGLTIGVLIAAVMSGDGK